MFRRPEALAVCPPGGDPRERGMFLNQTANYGLSQWEATDRILMENFNSDNSKIDAALKANADAIAAEAAARAEAIAAMGNCRVETPSYTGNGGYGEDNARTLNFTRVPVLVLICSHGPAIGFFAQGGSLAPVFATVSGSTIGDGNCSVTWSQEGKRMTWYSGYPNIALNLEDVTYYVYAFSMV